MLPGFERSRLQSVVWVRVVTVKTWKGDDGSDAEGESGSAVCAGDSSNGNTAIVLGGGCKLPRY